MMALYILKLKKLEHFKENLSILSKKIFLFFQRKSLNSFKENLSNIKHKFLKRFWSYNDGFEYQV